MKNLAIAVIAVMKEVKGMEKNSKVGKGQYAYDGTKDGDVKEVFNEQLAKNGLCVLPIGIEETTQIDRDEVTNQYGTSIKQSVFTKVKTRYLLLHESGESQEIVGYGHGIDPQDKGAGKATTYALKNALLYAFMTPVGKIEDTDKTHSADIPVSGKPEAKKEAPKKEAPAKKAKTPPTKEKLIERAVKLISGSKDMTELQANWKKVKSVAKEDEVLRAKEAKKAELTTEQKEA